MPRPVLWGQIAVLGVAGLLWAGCGPSPQLPAAYVTAPATVRVRVAGRIVAVPLEEYALGSALSEVTPTNESPATVARIYEVQAVLTRSYAVAHLGRHRAEGFDLCDGTHCQLYEPARVRTSRFATAARAAVEKTAGWILAYAQRPAEALYHADCGGFTAGADAVWGGQAVPYLVATRDNLPAGSHRTWTFAVPADELRAALNADARSQVGRTLNGVDVPRRDVSGRAVEVAIRGESSKLVRGEDLRAILNQRFGDRAIQSTLFKIRTSGRSYIFEGSGFGHGVGLCQLGAIVRARRGDTLNQILKAYFGGANLAKIRA